MARSNSAMGTNPCSAVIAVHDRRLLPRRGGVRDQGGFPQPMTNDGYRAQPFWSSLSRVQRIVKSVPAYAGCGPHEISWQEFRERWGARPHHGQRESRGQLERSSRRWLRSLGSRDSSKRGVSYPQTSKIKVATKNDRRNSVQMRNGNRRL